MMTAHNYVWEELSPRLKHTIMVCRERYVLLRNYFTERVTGRPGGFRLATLDAKPESLLPWVLFAKFLVNRNYSPSAYLTAAFRHNIQRPPLVTELARAKYERVFLNSRPTAEMIQQQLKNERIAALTKHGSLRFVFPKLDDDGLWRVVIDDANVPLSYLFRYCLADKLNFQLAKDEFAAPAYDQYLQEAPLYDQYWSHMLPDGFTEQAEAWHNNTLTRGNRNAQTRE